MTEGPRFRFPDGELDTSLTIGAVTDRSVRAWMRHPGGDVTVRLRVGPEAVATATLRPDPARDHVGAVELAVDPPRPDEPFVVEAAATAAGDLARAGRFSPAPGARVPFRFAFGSCHEPFEEEASDGRLRKHAGAAIYEAMRERLRELDARFVLLVGDQVYSDAVTGASVRERLEADGTLSDEDLLATYRHLYRGYFAESGFRALTESFPVYLTWDDHDIFDGAGSMMHPGELERRLFRAASRSYVEYQYLRDPGASLDDEPPFSYPVWYADVGCYVLDLRGCRSFEDGRIMGEEQWSRLDGFLDEADERDVPTVFIAASVPVVHGSPAVMALTERVTLAPGRDIRDRWVVPTFHHERDRMVERLFAWQSARPRRQVAILSGDVHVGAAFSARPRRGPGTLAQWTSSALSTPSGFQHGLANRFVTSLVRLGEHGIRVWRRGLVTGNNLGIVEVEPDPAGGHVLRFTIEEYDRRSDRLRVALEDVRRPGDGGR